MLSQSEEESFLGYKGSTYRKEYIFGEKEYKIERVPLMKRKLIMNDSTKEVPVTEIDQEFFDPGFYIPREGQSYYYNPYSSKESNIIYMVSLL